MDLQRTLISIRKKISSIEFVKDGQGIMPVGIKNFTNVLRKLITLI